MNTLMPWKLRRSPDAQAVAVKPEPAILSLLRAGRANEAYEVAWRRLYVSGFTPLARDVHVPRTLAQRLAAALLIPIRHQDMYTLARMALIPPKERA